MFERDSKVICINTHPETIKMRKLECKSRKLSLLHSKSNQIVLFGADYEFDHWRKAFSKHNITLSYFSLQEMNDLAIKGGGSDKDYDFFISADDSKMWNPLGEIWRIGAVNPPWRFEPTLQALAFMKEDFELINSAESHLICANRIRMLKRLNTIPTIRFPNFQYFVTGRYIVESNFKPKYPFVLKIGNFQGGIMKWKITNGEQWTDFFDSLRAMNYPVIIEEYITFQTEYRALFIGEHLYLIKRKNIPGWKVQHSQSQELIPMPKEIQELTLKAKEAVGLDIGALDIVENTEGYTVLEINDAPDINPKFLGVEENIWDMVANIL